VRLSLGRPTTEADVDRALDAIVENVRTLQEQPSVSLSL